MKDIVSINFNNPSSKPIVLKTVASTETEFYFPDVNSLLGAMSFSPTVITPDGEEVVQLKYNLETLQFVFADEYVPPEYLQDKIQQIDLSMKEYLPNMREHFKDQLKIREQRKYFGK